MYPYLKSLAKNAPFLVSAYPNAGLPNEFGEYEETPEKILRAVIDPALGGQAYQGREMAFKLGLEGHHLLRDLNPVGLGSNGIDLTSNFLTYKA